MASPDVLSVSQFNRRVQGVLEGQVPLCWIEGEISNLATPASGHLYFTLKDDESQVRAAMFRNRGRLLAVKPRNGMLVRVRARPTLYLPRGDYQLLVEHMEDAGQGALQRAFELLKAQLAAEGLFAAERKQEIPRHPRAIGIVTSPGGAAVHDIVTVLRRRAPWIPLVLYPTPVQGGEAAAGIVNAIRTANRRDEVDVLIVGRGGGSLEDLWSFNEECVARAIAGSAIPVISAVGHETDVTIADFVADLRAPTPSAAAERVAPPRDELLARTRNAERAMARHLLAQLRDSRSRLNLARKSLQRPDQRLRELRQQFDELEMRAGRALRGRLDGERQAAAELARRLRQASPDRELPARAAAVAAALARLSRVNADRMARRKLLLENAAARLNAISPLATLARGYAITRTTDGKILRRAADTRPGALLNVRLAEGALDCTVTRVQDAD